MSHEISEAHTLILNINLLYIWNENLTGHLVNTGLPQWLSCKESTCNVGAAGDVSSIPESGMTII